MFLTTRGLTHLPETKKLEMIKYKLPCSPIHMRSCCISSHLVAHLLHLLLQVHRRFGAFFFWGWGGSLFWVLFRETKRATTTTTQLKKNTWILASDEEPRLEFMKFEWMGRLSLANSSIVWWRAESCSSSTTNPLAQRKKGRKDGFSRSSVLLLWILNQITEILFPSSCCSCWCWCWCWSWINPKQITKKLNL